MVDRNYLKKRWHTFTSLTLIGFTVLSYLLQVGLGESTSIKTVFFGFIFLLLGASISNDLRRELNEDYLVRDNVFLWFLTGFLGSRFTVLAAGLTEKTAGELIVIPVSQVWIAGYHLHHFFWGMILVTFSTVLLLEEVNVSRTKIAAVFGLGLGMLADEAGLLLSMGNYFSDATFPIVGLLTLILYLNVERNLIKTAFYKITRLEKKKEVSE